MAIVTDLEVRLSKCDVFALHCARYEREGLRLISVEWNGPRSWFHFPGGGFLLRFTDAPSPADPGVPRRRQYQ